ncbi:MAG: geranylgeranyl reductase family protein [Vicinamibacterales bacterium]
MAASFPSTFDTIVVGAGPAGATAARTLALGGVRTLLVDKARFPRQKPCGGALSMRVVRRFPYLEPALSRISTHRVSRLHLEGPSGTSVRLTSDAPAALMIRRIEFDQLLVDLAREAGATLMEGTAIAQARADDSGVSLRTREGVELRAGTVIAADSVNSVVARRLGLNGGWPKEALALDMMEESPVDRLSCADPDTLWVSYRYRGSDGYAYVFPKAAHVNVGIGYVLRYYEDEVPESPYQLQQAFVRTLTERGILGGASQRETFTPFLIPVGGPLPQTVRGRVMLAGDAGGFVNGITAEGMYYAMVTGELAARTRLDAGPDGSLSEYERRWRREVGQELRESVAVQQYLFADAARADAVIDGARRRPHVAMAVVDYAMGRLSYRQARRRLLLGLPLAALRLAWWSRTRDPRGNLGRGSFKEDG